MPKANRVRVSNIRLDKDSKVIGDKTWELFENNTIFLLENGGGKTSIIQLLHQVVLPNHTIQKRDMVNGVRKNSTRHIAIEWNPDDEHHPNFVTGFCFHNYGVKRSKDDNRTYDYFNYIFEYDREDGLRLEELPFIKDSMVTNLEQLKKELKDIHGVHFFDSNKQYQEALEQYGLLETEWRNIAKVNGEEGGVTEFFDNTNKTVTLIDRLLIPSLTESLYDTSEERNAILESFRKYQKGLLELPELEMDLRDFEVINDHSDPIIDSFDQLEQAMKDLENAKENLTKLYVTVNTEFNDNEELQSKIEEQLIELEEQQNILEWKMDSYQVHLLEEVLDRYDEESNEKGEELSRLREEARWIDNKIKEQKASKEFKRYKEHRRIANGIESKLEVAKLEVAKRNGEFLNAQKKVSEQYQYLKNGQERKKSEKEEQRAKIDLVKSNKSNELENKHTEKSNLGIQIAKLESFIDQYNKENSLIQNDMGDLWTEDAAKTDEMIQKELEKEKMNYEQEEAKLSQIRSEINELREKIIHIENSIPVAKNELEEANEKFDSFTKGETILKDKVMSTIPFSLADDIFEEKEIILFNLKRKHNQINQEHIKISVSLDHLIQLKNGVEQRGYHVHTEIESMKEYLTNKGIDVVTGAEWVTNLSLSKEEKETLLKKNPILSFSILVETTQITEIKNALKIFKEKLTVPIVFVDRLQMDKQTEKETFYSMEDNLYVFHQFNVKLTTSDWEKYVQQIEGTIEEKESEVKVLNEKKQNIDHIIYQLTDFLKDYNEYTRVNFSKRIQSLEEKVQAQLNEKEELGNKMDELDGDKEILENTLEQTKERIGNIENKRVLIQSFIQRYKDIDSTFIDVKNLESLLQTVNESIKVLKNEEAVLGNKLGDIEQELIGIKQKIDNLNRDYREYGYERTENQTSTDEEAYEKVKSYYIQLRNESSMEEAQVENFQTSLNTYQNLMQEAADVIKDNGLTIEAMERMNLVYDERLLEQFKDDYRLFNDDIHELDKKMAVLNQEINNKENELEKALDKMDEEPFEYGQTAESEYELYKSEKESLKAKQEKLDERIDEIKEQNGHLKTAVVELERRKELFVRIQDTVPLEDEQWDKENPMEDVHSYKGVIEKQQRKIGDKQQAIRNNIWNLKEDTQKTGNAHLIHSMAQFIKIFEGSNYDETITSFYKMLEGIQGFRQSLESRRKHSDNSRSELIEQMYQRAEVIHKNIVDIAKSSQIEENGKVVNLIEISWPKNEFNYAKHQFRTFVDSVLSDLVKLKNEGSTDKEIEEKFDKLANLFNIVNCYADVNKCTIKVLKPKNDLLAGREEYVIWDNIDSEWSGGERQIARISMFISFLNHLRKTRFAKEITWKFIVFDNPFDKMQSEHVVRPMIELAKRTSTQLLCFTGINDKTIQQEFDTVISNQYVVQHGALLMESKMEHKKKEASLEALFYAR